MRRWMGLHFPYWTDYNGVAFSGIFIELLEWDRTFSGLSESENHLPKSDLDGVYNWPQNWPELDYNWVLRCQQHISSNNWPRWPPLCCCVIFPYSDNTALKRFQHNCDIFYITYWEKKTCILTSHTVGYQQTPSSDCYFFFKKKVNKR